MSPSCSMATYEFEKDKRFLYSCYHCVLSADDSSLASTLGVH